MFNNYFRDWGFGLALIVGSWSIWGKLEQFHGWLDNTLPWRLRYRLKCMWEENKSLCTALQEAQWEILQLRLDKPSKVV